MSEERGRGVDHRGWSEQLRAVLREGGVPPEALEPLANKLIDLVLRWYVDFEKRTARRVY